MKDVNIYMVTCDKTNWVLSVTIPLMDKYWNIEKSVKILGFNKPDIELGEDYEFISMGPKQESIDNWSKDIHSVIKNDPNEYVIFMLDDFLPRDYINEEIFDFLFDKIKNDNNIMRCGLGIDLTGQLHNVIEKRDNFNVIELLEKAEYKVTTQISIWKKDLLLQYLYMSTNPWNFEVQNQAYEHKVIGTSGEYAFKWIEESALSGRHPGKFNVLGLKKEDIKWIIDSGLVTEDKIQYGQHVGRVPQFSQVGFDFKIEHIKNCVNTKKYAFCVEKYGKIY